MERKKTAPQFLAAVRKLLPDITNERDAEIVDLSILQLHEEGWTVDEAASFTRLLEEVSPGLATEAEAVRQMMAIKKAVKVRLGKA